MSWGSVVYCRRHLRLLDLRQALTDLLELGEATQLLFAEDALAIQIDLEDAPTRGDDLQRGDLVLILAQDLLRQTDGFGNIPSTGSVFDANLH